ncbi:MAG TPA: lipopolysaccharide biosynthesis protein RfbH [Patescibacteria group bacterium]|nr:lipopolysaccharide biosynthesis protein RfbH [Patescibacteria group bacterium]
MNSKAALKKRIHSLIAQYFKLHNKRNSFIPGKSTVHYAGAVYSAKELNVMADVLLNGWFGMSKQGELFEKELAGYIGAQQAFLVNSGSSADLLAFATLTSYQFPGHLQAGDEVITPACTFPTLVASLVHHRLIPVFVDVDPETLNPLPEDIERAIGKKTRAIFVVHTLGNPNDMDDILSIAKKHNLFLIEDNCDALGSTYKGRKTGSFGILSTESFYPAHHITTAGEGGALLINDRRLTRIAQSLRDWGRACWCGASGGGPNGVCGKRFNYRIGDIPYDHKYIFSHVGYNLKPVEIQAAMGRIQLSRIENFTSRRKKNFALYHALFKKYEHFFILPKATKGSDPSWFSYPLTVRSNAPFDRFTITKYLERHRIETRPMFAGNILRQPGFRTIPHRVSGTLNNSDHIFSHTFFIGVYPGLTQEHVSYVKRVFENFFRRSSFYAY